MRLRYKSHIKNSHNKIKQTAYISEALIGSATDKKNVSKIHF